MSVPICYCYDYDEEAIRADVCANNGRSLILEHILAAKQKGACRCAETHPEGR